MGAGTISMFELMDDAQLVESLLDHHSNRGGKSFPVELASACVALLSAAPYQRLDEVPQESLDLIRRIGDAEIPESRVCRICIERPNETGELATLLALPLWEPVRILAHRTLADLGRRTTLARVLSPKGPFEVAEADAWMEAARPPDADPPVVVAGDSDWSALLIAELTPDTHEEVLRKLALQAAPNPAGRYATAEVNRVVARANAALARLALARGAGPAAPTMGASIPSWENAYLRGLGEWQRGNERAAQEHLREAFHQNPHQTCTRLALSSLVAKQSPEEAFELTEHEEPTRDLLTHRAALLARWKRYEEADQALAQPANWEAVRYSWARGRVELEQRQRLLLTALAERRGQWTEAEKNWQFACPSGAGRTLMETRELFIARGQLSAPTSSGKWVREIVQRKVDRLTSRVGEGPLTGDASFFRSAALLNSEPGRALKDLQALRHRRAWQDAERSVGGGRLVFVGDALLRLGKPDDACALYRSMPAFRERAEVASVYAALLRRESPEKLISAAAEAQSSWPKLLVALALQIAGMAPAATDLLNSAPKEGAPPAVCDRLRALSDTITGAIQVDQEKLVALGLPLQVVAAVYLAVGSDPEPTRAKAYVAALGSRWIEFCPLDPEKVARSLLSAWCAEGSWDDALKFAGELALSGQGWAEELSTLTRLRHALERSGRGELAEAEMELEGVRDGTIS